MKHSLLRIFNETIYRILDRLILTRFFTRKTPEWYLEYLARNQPSVRDLISIKSKIAVEQFVIFRNKIIFILLAMLPPQLSAKIIVALIKIKDKLFARSK